MDIKEIRQKMPEYSDLSDEQLAKGLHKKYYSDMPYEDFASKIGVKREQGAPERFAKGVVRGVRDVIDRPAAWLAGVVSGEDERKRVEALNQQGQQEYTDTGGGFVAGLGRIGGQMLTTAPLVAATGAGVAAAGAPRLGAAIGSFGSAGGSLPMNMAGGAISGGISAGAVDPENALTGAVIGGLVPPALMGVEKGAEAVGKVVRPFTKKGQEAIAADVVRRSTQDPAAVSARLASPPQGITPQMFHQVADDPGVTGLMRQMQNSNPAFAADLAARRAAQQEQQFQTLYNLPGPGGGRAATTALEEARRNATDPMFRNIEKQYGNMPLGTKGIRSKVDEIMGTARYQTDAVRGEVDKVASRFGNPADGWLKKQPMSTVWGARQNIDQRMHGGQGLDPKATAQEAAGELGQIRERLSNALDKVPGFRDASKVYASLSKPVAASKTVNDLLEKAAGGQTVQGGSPMLNAASYMNALKRLQSTEAGRKEWANLTDTQRKTILTLGEELTRAVRTEIMGKAVGSNTVQNMMAGNQLSAVERLLTGLTPAPGGVAGSIASAVTAPARSGIQSQLEGMLLDPRRAAIAYAPPAPSGGLLSPLLQREIGRGAVGLPAGLLASQP